VTLTNSNPSVATVRRLSIRTSTATAITPLTISASYNGKKKTA
jgi:hypothetical protein